MAASAPPAPDLLSLMTKPPVELGPEEIQALQRLAAGLADRNRALSSQFQRAVDGVQSDNLEAFKESKRQSEQMYQAAHSQTVATYQHQLNMEAHKINVLKQQLHHMTQQHYGFRQHIEQRFGQSAVPRINLAVERPQMLSTPQFVDAHKRQRLNAGPYIDTTVHSTHAVTDPNAANKNAAMRTTAAQHSPPKVRSMMAPVANRRVVRHSVPLHQMQPQQLVPGPIYLSPHNGHLQSQQRCQAVQQMTDCLPQQMVGTHPQHMNGPFSQQMLQRSRLIVNQNMSPLQQQRQAFDQNKRNQQQMGQVSSHNPPHGFPLQMQIAPQAGTMGVPMGQNNGVYTALSQSDMPGGNQTHPQAKTFPIPGNLMQNQQPYPQNTGSVRGQHALQSQAPMIGLSNMQQTPVLPLSQAVHQSEPQMHLAQPLMQEFSVPANPKAQGSHKQLSQRKNSRMGEHYASQSRVPMENISSVQQEFLLLTSKQSAKGALQAGTSFDPVDLSSPTMQPTPSNIGQRIPVGVGNKADLAMPPMTPMTASSSPEASNSEEVSRTQSEPQNMVSPSPHIEEDLMLHPEFQHVEGQTSVTDLDDVALTAQSQPQQLGSLSLAYSLDEDADDSAVSPVSAASGSPPTSVGSTENHGQDDDGVSQEDLQNSGANEDAPDHTSEGAQPFDLAGNDAYAGYVPANTLLHGLPNMPDNMYGEEGDFCTDGLSALLEREIQQGSLEVPEEHLDQTTYHENLCVDPRVLELSNFTTFSDSPTSQHDHQIALMVPNQGQHHAGQGLMNIAEPVLTSLDHNDNVEEYRKVACLNCHTNWWEDSCDGGEPCRNCAGRTDCMRPRCSADAAGACKKGNECKMVHRSDSHYHGKYLVDAQKLPKRAGTKAKAKTAPSVLGKRRREELGLA